ncbi:MAG: hypothetical protein HOP15_00395 [Planctomycetes bacterium]|nr:hypothetical protein [Planctomycetota bacterium]
MDQEVRFQSELHSAPSAGSAAPIGLNPNLAPGRNVILPFRITPNGKRVVFLADQDTATAFECYCVPIDGSAKPVKVSGKMTEGGDVVLGPYLADQQANEVFELYLVAASGSTPPLRVNNPLVSGGDVQGDFRMAPDLRHVLNPGGPRSGRGLRAVLARAGTAPHAARGERDPSQAYAPSEAAGLAGRRARMPACECRETGSRRAGPALSSRPLLERASPP